MVAAMQCTQCRKLLYGSARTRDCGGRVRMSPARVLRAGGISRSTPKRRDYSGCTRARGNPGMVDAMHVPPSPDPDEASLASSDLVCRLLHNKVDSSEPSVQSGSPPSHFSFDLKH